MRGLIIATVDRLLYAGAALFACICIWNIFKYFRRGFVYINGKKAFRSEDRLGFWLVMASWAIIAAFLFWRILSAFQNGSLP